MNIVLFGASGMIGSRVLSEFSSRGHRVKAIVRDPARVPALPGVTALQGDIFDVESVAATVRGADVVVSAYGPGPENAQMLVDAVRSLLQGIAAAGVKRVIAVGGAGSLEVAPGVTLVEAPGFPPAWKAIALAHGEALQLLKRSNLDWTSVSPAAEIQPGETTGKFRLGTDQLLTDASGHSKISTGDFAVAIADEVEQNAHIRQRFTAAY